MIISLLYAYQVSLTLHIRRLVCFVIIEYHIYDIPPCHCRYCRGRDPALWLHLHPALILPQLDLVPRAWIRFDVDAMFEPIY